MGNMFSKDTFVGVLAALAILGFVRYSTGKNLGI